MKDGSIVFIGMTCSGKSTIGILVANALNFRFIDLDDYIFKKDGRVIQQIIDDEGEGALLQIEKLCMYEINLDNIVVSPGGSIIYHDDLMEYLKRNATLIYLNSPFENIENRLTDAYSRGVVGLKNKTLKQIYDEREPLYYKYADIIIDCGSKLQDKIVEKTLIHYFNFINSSLK